MKKIHNLILPGDKGFNEQVNDKYLWNVVRKQAGLPKKTGAAIEITGFFIQDQRTKPNIAIFKNCKFYMIVGFHPPLEDVPVPFQYVGEAYAFIKKMNLPSDQEQQMSIVAMAPDPGMGQPHPNFIFMDRDLLKER